MENYNNDSSEWHQQQQHKHWSQYSTSDDHSHFPTQILPHNNISDSSSASFQYSEFQSSWPLPIEESLEDRAISASKSHSQAEKRRRDRINTQLANLRKLIPKSDKVNQFFFFMCDTFNFII
jgi:hypothetical protein